MNSYDIKAEDKVSLDNLLNNLSIHDIDAVLRTTRQDGLVTKSLAHAGLPKRVS